MSIDAMHWVWECSDSKGVARHILLAVADSARSNVGDCIAYGSSRFFAERANCTKGAVAEALEFLLGTKELELVTDEAGNVVKGKFGAPYYRLPLAIGFVRAAIRNRPAQPGDSKDRDSSDRPAQPGGTVPRSAGRSKAKSPGSAGHTTSSSPSKTTTSVPRASADAHATDGGGGGQQDKHHEDALALVADLDYLGQWPSLADQQRLAEAITAALSTGLSIGDLRRHLDLKSGKGIDSAAAVYLARLRTDRLPAPPAQRRSGRGTGLKPWCGKCNGGIEPASPNLRFTEDAQGRAVKCRCHPNYQS
jgi:hypothetical protein